jgi:hypothetical protein
VAKQTIGLGAAPNDGTGDPLRDALDKVNDNFDEVYSAFVFASNNATAANNVLIGSATINSVSNSTVFQLSTATDSLVVSATNLAIGNSTVNAVVNSTVVSVGNSTVNAVANSTALVVDNATVANATISSNTFTYGSSTNAANGYSVLPNGLIMQWGSVSSNTTVGDITFPTAFNDLWSITATSETGTYDATYATQLIASDATTANVRTGNATAITVSYLAIGNN